MKNVQLHGGTKFASGFIECINKYRTLEDFEVSWQELVFDHGVEHKSWAVELYNAKEKWAEAYLQGYFFGGINIIIFSVKICITFI